MEEEKETGGKEGGREKKKRHCDRGRKEIRWRERMKKIDVRNLEK
jgi:hypothetical protein